MSNRPAILAEGLYKHYGKTRALAGLDLEAEEVAIGVFRIINSQMADLIRKCTIEQGHDPRTCMLVAYGGAGPTHAVFYGHDIGAKITDYVQMYLDDLYTIPINLAGLPGMSIPCGFGDGARPV